MELLDFLRQNSPNKGRNYGSQFGDGEINGEGDGSTAGAGVGSGSGWGAGDGAPVWLTFKNPNFLMSSWAINSLALSEGWYSSQNTYLLLSLHNTDAGTHVKAGRILPNEQHGESELLNPTTNSIFQRKHEFYFRH